MNKLMILLFVGCVGAANASTDVLHKPVQALQAKDMQFEVILRKVAEANGIHLVLGEGFPGSKKIASLDAKNLTISKFFDVIAQNTKTQWTASETEGVVTVTFEKPSRSSK